MTNGQLENDGRRQLKSTPSTTNGREAKTVPFAERLSCTIDEACEATGLGRTKLYELIGTGQLTTTTVGRRRLVMVRSLLALLDKTMSA
jgi:excisionase family DNA binding protein